MNQDQVIVCEDCHQEFPWTKEEQEFYGEKGLEAPKYCMICRGKYQAREKDLRKWKK
jgi:hypothetical protein